MPRFFIALPAKGKEVMEALVQGLVSRQIQSLTSGDPRVRPYPVRLWGRTRVWCRRRYCWPGKPRGSAGVVASTGGLRLALSAR